MKKSVFRGSTEEATHGAGPSSTSSKDPGTLVQRGGRSLRGTPRWVIISGAIILALVLLFVILHSFGIGFGSGMHMPGM